MRPTESLSPRHPTCLAVLTLVSDLEACLRELSEIDSAPEGRPLGLYQLIEEHKDKATFFDYWGVHSARFIRNRIAHRDQRPGAPPLSLPEVERAKATFEYALREILPLCSRRLQDEIGGEAPARQNDVPEIGGSKPHLLQSSPRNVATAQPGKVENVCPECGHQFKGKGFDGIDAHWRAKHEALMPYEEAWPLIRSGTYSRLGHQNTFKGNAG